MYILMSIQMREKKRESILTIRISDKLKNNLKFECEKNNVTMSEYIISYLEYKLENND